MKHNLKRYVILMMVCFFVLCLQASVFAYTAPNLSSSAYHSENIFTQSGYKGQCTWFVWGRTLETLGVKLNSQFYGNAKTWWTRNTTYPSGQTPKDHSIAVFKNGSAGHVVFVEYVQGDTIYYNEANHHNRGQYDGALESAPIRSFINRAGEGNFAGFIYLTGNNTGDNTGDNHGFSYDNNATVSGDFFYVRDAKGNIIPNKRVNNGDKITVLDVSYTKQLVLVEYPTPNGVQRGFYIENVPSCIQYKWAYQWQNGSTSEAVYDQPGGNVIGSINPGEKATPLYKKDGMLCLVYNTSKGVHTKSGFVKYNGGFHGF